MKNSWHRRAAACVAAALLVTPLPAWSQAPQTAAPAAPATPAAPGFLPGQRVLLDAHNCYPYEGRWADRADRALACGAPLAIEQDLIWDATTDPGHPRIVVSHGGKATGHEPTLRDYFFEKVRPLVEAARREGDRRSWPLVTLNINDLRAEEPAFFTALWQLLDDYDSWFCTAPKTADPTRIAAIDVGPVLVLTSDGPNQRRVFHDNVPEGGRLRLFAAGEPDRPADNFRRWVNYAWREVEPKGQPKAGAWTPEAAARLKERVDRAHRQGYWIRFYTLNGHGPEELASRGWTASYNFGSPEAVAIRWKAARDAGVDFVATDQYEEFTRALRGR